MKKLLMALCCVIAFFPSKAQQIKYQPSLGLAKQQALSTGKPIAIFLTISMPGRAPSSQAGLAEKEVVDKFNDHFINYKVALEDSVQSKPIVQAYRIRRFPSFIFLDSKGGLLYTDVALTGKAAAVLPLLDKALSLSQETSLVDFDSLYKSGTQDSKFLKDYITKRQSAGITNNAALIEQYVVTISVADLNNYEEALFILKAGPYVDSNAYRLLSVNKKVYDSIYKKEPLEVRKAINNTIISNSLQSAIANRNINRANAVANFTQTSWGKNYVEAAKSRQLKMMQYYMGIRDTARYLQLAVSYYDRYYLGASVDSLKKKDSLRLETAKLNGTKLVFFDSTKNKTVQRNTFAYPKNNPDALELNSAAWYFYSVANKEDQLVKALLWSRRSIELDPRSAYYDTYAHLLFKLGLYAEAETIEEKAIEMAKTEKINPEKYQEALKKIISKTL